MTISKDLLKFKDKQNRLKLSKRNLIKIFSNPIQLTVDLKSQIQEVKSQLIVSMFPLKEKKLKDLIKPLQCSLR